MHIERLPWRTSSRRCGSDCAAAEARCGYAVLERGAQPAEVATDRLKLKEIVQNLVTNAVTFTPMAGSRRPIHGRGAAAVIVVRDTGIGIPPDDLSLIFESFAQSAAPPKGQLGGVGLGLYIVKRLIELACGTIDVQSALGAGTTFPRLRTAAPPQQRRFWRRRTLETTPIAPTHIARGERGP